MPRLMDTRSTQNMPPPVMPVMRSKARVLSNMDNKVTNATIGVGKAALERQRENASKLTSGRSVINKTDKENDVAKKKPAVKPPARPQKTKKEDKKETLKKTESTNSLYGLDTSKLNVKASEPQLKPKESTAKPFAPNPLPIPEPEPVLELEKKIESIPLGVHVIDRDEEYMNNEFLLGLYAKDIYSFLRYLEDSQSIRKEYLTPDHIMTKHMRSLLVDWFFEVQQSFKLLNETIQLAIALLDRFMQDHPGIVKTELQLVGVACIFLAAKYEEMYPPDLDDLVDISAKTYTKEQILKMELVIFASLKFQMGRPSPSQFLRRYGRAGKVDVITYCLSKYFIDLSLVNYELCHIPPSLIAAAALYLSLFLTSEGTNTEFWTPTLEYYSQYKWSHLEPVVSKLAQLVWNAPKSKYQTVQKKYLDPKKLYSVSARPELKSDKLLKMVSEA